MFYPKMINMPMLGSLLLTSLCCLSGTKSFASPNCTDDHVQALTDLQRGTIAVQKEVEQKALRPDRPMIELEKLKVVAQSSGREIPIRVNRYAAFVKPSKGTIVYLCGGPHACMNSRPFEIPTEYDVVISDPIGLGENSIGPAPARLMSIEAQGLATKKIISALQIKNYVIFGQSFGTAVATVAGGLIARDEAMPQPKAVVLSGTATAWKSQRGAEGYTETASRAWDLLTAEEKAKFRSNYEGIKDSAVRSATDNWLLQRLTYGAKNMAETLRSFRTPSARAASDGPGQSSFRPRPSSNLFPKEERGFSPATKDNGLDEDPKSYQRMYRASSCELINKRVKDKPDRLFGGLVENVYQRDDSCTCRTTDHDFDPGEYQIKAPLLYLQGDTDPATTLDGARIHFESQKTKKKLMLTFVDGGHYPLASNVSECSSEIFASAFESSFKDIAPPRDLEHGCGRAQHVIAPGSAVGQH